MASTLTFIIRSNPKAKQSFKFTKTGKKYTPNDVKEENENIRTQIVNQLPANFELMDGFILMSIFFIFYPPSNINKSDKSWLNNSNENVLNLIMKKTIPDFENLLKLMNDAMQGVVFTNDSRICLCNPIVKAYGLTPGILIKLEEIKSKSVKIEVNLNNFKFEDIGGIKKWD